jgi:hypothetical protein
VARAEDADVELDEVGRFCAEHGLWPGLARVTDSLSPTTTSRPGR